MSYHFIIFLDTRQITVFWAVLSDTAVCDVKPKDKPHKITDRGVFAGEIHWKRLAHG